MTVKDCVKDLSVAHLELIICLIQHGNASAAADELGMSQSTISYHLRRLRTIFDDEMFIRTGTGLKPTERCKQIGLIATELVTRVHEELLHAGHFEPSLISKEIFIVADDTVCNWYGQLLREIQQTMPNTQLCARPWNLHSMFDLDNGSIHFGIHVMPIGNKGIYEVELAPCLRTIVVHKDHPLARKGYVELTDLGHYPVVLNDLAGWNNNGNSILEKVTAEHNINMRIVARIGYVGSIYDAIADNHTITYTSLAALPDSLENHVVLLPPDELNRHKASYRLYTSRARYGSQETTYLVEFISKSFNQFIQRKFNRPELAEILPVLLAS
ncbi:LysR family transcriptional regulator [Ferrimonas lipolytica]|uniref:LysR family transcriptional regulator n=1 Tax=Ferrimonas lipolytica TaxID=2724191 RepID=A0A6H1UGR8_9GAMM|nr:LysR family transcriptional regulator [Ferrimonas lipolytica]QIZ78297.1 LysR family transcriptional regulator [Ferrimonas lipolytica]